MGGRGTALRSFPSCDWRREALRRPLRPRALRAARATAAIAHWRPGCPFRRLRHACTPQLGGAEAPPAQPLDRGKRAPSSCVCPARSAACWKRGRAGQLAPQRLSRCARVEPAAPPKAARPLLARGGRIAGVGRSPPPSFFGERACGPRMADTRATRIHSAQRQHTQVNPATAFSFTRAPPAARRRANSPPSPTQKQPKTTKKRRTCRTAAARARARAAPARSTPARSTRATSRSSTTRRWATALCSRASRTRRATARSRRTRRRRSTRCLSSVLAAASSSPLYGTRLGFYVGAEQQCRSEQPQRFLDERPSQRGARARAGGVDARAVMLACAACWCAWRRWGGGPLFLAPRPRWRRCAIAARVAVLLRARAVRERETLLKGS